MTYQLQNKLSGRGSSKEAESWRAIERTIFFSLARVRDSQNRHYLLDVLRGRFEYPALRDAAINLAKRFKPNFILIEDASTGTALAQEIKRAGITAVRLIKPERDKETRAYVQQAKFEAGLVLLPKGASYLPELESELLTFPQGRHDDIVDSIIQALAFKIGYDSTMQWVG